MNCHQCRQSCHTKSSNTGLRWFRRKSPDPERSLLTERLPKIALVGMPNVGKSALFNALTGHYATVSNYPGTTVEISQGRTTLGDRTVEIVDTPGMYSLLPITDEERVARDLLLNTVPDAIVHVIDAKNLGRMLPLTFQLLEAKLPVLLVLNMIDEAKQLQIQLFPESLAEELGIPVVMTAAAQQTGIRELKTQLAAYLYANQLSLTH